MFQYSTLTSLDKTATAAWTTEVAAEYWSMSDSLGNRSRIAQICISNAFNSKERRYQVMQQVRILGSYGVVLFLGRIMNIEPSLDENKLILTCRDYLGDLTERLVTASKSDGSYTASSRNWLIKEILDNEIEDPAAGGDIDRSLTSRLLQDPSNYLERITKTYAQRGSYGSVTDGVAGNYQYRGTKSVLEAISEIASEDAQQDLMVLSYANTKVLNDINSVNHTSDPKTYPSTYWVDYTAGLQDGNDWFPSMRHVRNVATPDAIDSASGTGQDILYIGSNSKFDGLEYTFRQTGVTIHESNYTTLAWQYWGGEKWKTFTPDKDSLFKQDPSVIDRLSGSTSWPSLITDTTNTHDNLGQISYAASGQGMSDWEKRDLAENYDMPHYNDWNNNSNSAWRDWRAPWHTETYNTFRIPDGDNELVLYKNSFTTDANLKTDPNAWMTGNVVTHGLRDGDKITISGLTSASGFNGTWYVRVSNDEGYVGHDAPGYVGDEHQKLTLYTVSPAGYDGQNDIHTTEWDTSRKKTNGTGSAVTQATVDANAASEARITVSHSLRQSDMKSEAIPSVNIGGLASTYRYWVRVWVKAAATSPAVPASIATLDTFTKSRLFRDFRAEDPKYFDEIWEYDTRPFNQDLSQINFANTPGGTWTSLNTTAGTSGLGPPLLWDSQANETKFLRDNRKAWFFGADEPFNGIELHAVQGFSIPITAITSANPAVVTVATTHGLANNDYVYIAGSNSVVSIDGYHQITNVTQKNDGGSNILLAEALDATETAIDVDNDHNLTVTDTILVGSEYMNIISISGNTLTVERGINASVHNDDSVVYNAKQFSVPVNTSGGAAGARGLVRTEVPDYSNVNISLELLDTYSKDYTAQSYQGYGLPSPFSAWRQLVFDDENVSWSPAPDPGAVDDITNFGPLAPLGPVRWRLDAGRSGELNHWYTELRFNTSHSRDSVTQVDTYQTPDHVYRPWETKRGISQPEYDSAYVMSDSPSAPNRASLLSVYSNMSHRLVNFTVDSISYNVDSVGTHKDSDGFSTGILTGVGSNFTASGADRLLVVGITTQNDGSPVVPSQVLYGGSDGPLLTKADDQTAGNVNTSVWYLVDPVHEATDDDDSSRFHITVASSVEHIDVNVMTVMGVNGDDPVGTAVKATGTGTTASLAAATKADQIVFDCLGVNSDPTATVGASQTQIANTAGNVNHRSASSYETATSASTTMSWSLNETQNWGLVALPINITLPYVRINLSQYNTPVTAINDGDGITNSDTAVVVDSVADLRVGQYIIVDSEQMYITKIVGVTLTVTRAANSTSAATHNNDAVVSIVGRASYDMRAGDMVSFWNTPGTHADGGWDGAYYVTDDKIRDQNDTFDFDMRAFGVNFTGVATGQTYMESVANPPNTKGLHWVRFRISGAPNQVANLRSARMSSGARFKYFDRGKEPWVTNPTLTPNSSSALLGLEAVYYYDKSRLGDLNGTATYASNKCEVWRISAQNGYAMIQTKAAAGSSASDHYLVAGDWIEILNAEVTPGSGSAVPQLNGIWKVAYVVDDTRFVINTTHSGSQQYNSGSGNAPVIFPTSFTDYTAEANSDASYRDLSIARISKDSQETNTVITTEEPHELGALDGVLIGLTENSDSNPSLGSTSTPLAFSVRNTTSFNRFILENLNGSDKVLTTAGVAGSIRTVKLIASVSAGSPAVITTKNAHELIEGQRIIINGITSGSPSLNSGTNAYLVKEVLTETTFTIPVNTTQASSVNTGYIIPQGATLLQSLDASNSFNGLANLIQAHDAVYFGSRHPFTQLRFDLEERLGGFGVKNGYLSRSWEYLRSDLYGRTDGWEVVGAYDPGHGWLGRGGMKNLETSLNVSAFGVWKPSNPGIAGSSSSGYVAGVSPQTVVGGSLDQRIGRQLYYQRCRITSLGSAAGGGATPTDAKVVASKIGCGPNLWNRDREVGTLPSVTSDRHATGVATYGAVFDDRAKSIGTRNKIQIMEYSLKDKGFDFVNRITVRGRSGAYATVDDKESIDFYRVVKEQVEEDSSLVTDTQCFQRASSLLEQLKPRKPLNVLTIDAANPAKITIGGSTKYHLWSSPDGANATFRVFERAGLKITSNSRGVEETATDGTGTPDTGTNAPTTTNNFTYVTTETDHGLTTGDVVLFSNIQTATEGHTVTGTTRWRFGGVTGLSGSNQGAATIYVVSPRKFKWTTTGGTSAYGYNDDAIGGFVHKPAKTKLQIGDEVRVVGHGINADGATHNGLQTVVTSADDGATLTLTYTTNDHGHGAAAGYLLAAEKHNLSDGDRVLLRNTTSIPTVDGYREITRTNATQFTLPGVDLSTGKDGAFGSVRATSIREATIKVKGWPVYTVQGKPRAVRSGDMVSVTLANSGIFDETWFCYSLAYEGKEGDCALTLFRDLSAVSEPGDPTKKNIRDLGSRLRETANAVFQPIDKTVESGLDFLPEGPGRTPARLEYSARGATSDIDIFNPATFGDYDQVFPDDFRFSYKMYENFSTRENAGTDLLRVDAQGLRPDGTGDATGGGGLTLLGRSKTGETGATADFHPDSDEATIYLRQGRTFNITAVTAANPAVITTDAVHGLTTSDHVVISDTNSGAADSYDGRVNGTFKVNTVPSTTTFSVAVDNSVSDGSAITNAGTVKVLTTGSGLYLANRGIWNSSGMYDEWDHDTPAMQHEIFTGISGFVEPYTDGKAIIHLPSLDAIPHIFLTVCSADSSASDQYIANITGWTVSDTGATYFTGTGANDMTVTYNSFASTSDTSLSYRVQIDGTSSPNTFKWSDNRVSAATRNVWNAATVNTSTSNVTLNNSITVKWAATTGHASGDYWDFSTHTTSRRKYKGAEITVFNDAGSAVDCVAGDVHVMYMAVFNSSRAQDGLNNEVNGGNRSGFSIDHDADSGH